MEQNYIEKARKLDKLASGESGIQHVNRIIDEAAKELANDRPEKAAEALQELAFSIRGLGKDGLSLLQHTRRVVVTMAYKLNETIELPESEQNWQIALLKDRLVDAEVKLKEKRRQIHLGAK